MEVLSYSIHNPMTFCIHWSHEGQLWGSLGCGDGQTGTKKFKKHVNLFFNHWPHSSMTCCMLSLRSMMECIIFWFSGCMLWSRDSMKSFNQGGGRLKVLQLGLPKVWNHKKVGHLEERFISFYSYAYVNTQSGSLFLPPFIISDLKVFIKILLKCLTWIGMSGNPKMKLQ